MKYFIAKISLEKILFYYIRVLIFLILLAPFMPISNWDILGKDPDAPLLFIEIGIGLILINLFFTKYIKEIKIDFINKTITIIYFFFFITKEKKYNFNEISIILKKGFTGYKVKPCLVISTKKKKYEIVKGENGWDDNLFQEIVDTFKEIQEIKMTNRCNGSI